MKVSLFSTYDHYGAGAAVHRLQAGLSALAVDSTLYVADATKPGSTVLASHYSDYVFANHLFGSAGFGNPFSSLHLGLSEEQVEQIAGPSQIVNVHWVSNFVSLDNLAQMTAMGKRLVVTLHDENLYTGGCHYRHGCQKYLDRCSGCPQLPDLPRVPEAILAAKRMKFPREAVIVSPSRWLADLAAESQVLRENKVVVIPNGIDETVYTPTQRSRFRRRLGIEEDELLVLFGAQFLEDERKGLRYLLEAVELLRKSNLRGRVRFLCFGGKSNDLPSNITATGYIDDEQELAGIYAAADVTVIPSLEDNLPNIMLESLMCGTPVVGFAVGGLQEGIIEGKNGRLVPEKNAAALAEAIEQCLASGGGFREFCRKDAVARYSSAAMAKRYLALFQTLAAAEDAPPPYDPLLWQLALDMECKAHVETKAQLEQERAYMKMYDRVYAAVVRESQSRPIALYGYGIIGRHIDEVMGGLIDYIMDQKPLADPRYRSPEQLPALREENAFVIVSPLESGEITGRLKALGFSFEADYLATKDKKGTN